MSGVGGGGDRLAVAAYAATDKIGTITIAPKRGIGVFIIRLFLFARF
jgi:hypothetical protein